MILNARRYNNVAKEEKRAYLDKLKSEDVLQHLDELLEVARPFLKKKLRSQPIALAMLIKRG